MFDTMRFEPCGHWIHLGILCFLVYLSGCWSSKTDDVQRSPPTPNLESQTKYNLESYNLPSFDLFNFTNLDFHIKYNQSSVRFYLYTVDCPEGQRLIIDRTPMRFTCFNNTQDLKILIHGYTEMGHSVNSMVPIRRAYLRMKTKANVLVADWSRHSLEPIYFNAAAHLDEVGHYVATLIDYIRMSTNYNNMTKIHMIGFSLGAHVSGLTGRHIRKMTGQNIGRITGLDPAGPKFFSLLAKDRIRLDDADFLDFIHADIDTYGGNFHHQAHANFYPNGGKKQPGCGSFIGQIIGCGHRKAPQWFTESILQPNKFIGCRCGNYTLFQEKACSCHTKSDLAVMGEHCSLHTRGIFFLHISSGQFQYETGVYPNSFQFAFTSHVTIHNTTFSMGDEVQDQEESNSTLTATL